MEVRVVGSLTSGQQFYGTAAIKVIDKSWDLIASLASYWLHADCRRPHWCEGLDLNRDSTVNFADLAAPGTEGSSLLKTSKAKGTTFLPLP
jgi:hypothetical protein